MCDYLLVKGSLSNVDTFDVSIQNVPCGTTGVACSKSVTLTVGGNESPESIVFTRGKELPSGNFKRIITRTTDLFVFVDVPDMGLTLQWDKGRFLNVSTFWNYKNLFLCFNVVSRHQGVREARSQMEGTYKGTLR